MKMRTGHVEGGFSNGFWQVTLSEKGPPERGGVGGVCVPPSCVADRAVKLNWAPGFKVVWESPWVYYTSPLPSLSLSKHFLVCILALTRTPVVDCFWSFF